MHIVVELEFPWGEDGTREDELLFADLVLAAVNRYDNPMRPNGGEIASVRSVRGSMKLARELTGGSDE